MMLDTSDGYDGYNESETIFIGYGLEARKSPVDRVYRIWQLRQVNGYGYQRWVTIAVGETLAEARAGANPGSR
jgi:hypothetical protein